MNWVWLILLTVWIIHLSERGQDEFLEDYNKETA